MTEPMKLRDIDSKLVQDAKAEMLQEARAKRRKLRKAASKAHAEMGQETAYKGRWIRHAETSGIRKARKPSEEPAFLERMVREIDRKAMAEAHGTSFVLSEIERAAVEDQG